jgi:hypothetical protein
MVVSGPRRSTEVETRDCTSERTETSPDTEMALRPRDLISSTTASLPVELAAMSFTQMS